MTGSRWTYGRRSVRGDLASTFGCFVLSLLACAGTTPALGQDQDRPDGAVILDKFVEASGGKAAYDKLQNRVSKGTFEFVGAGIKGTLTVYEARPNKSRAIIEAEGLGRIEQGTDGTVAWDISPMEGARLKEGDDLAMTLREAVFDALVQWRSLYKKVECVGSETIGEQDCYKLVLAPKDGDPEIWYIDKKTHLLAKKSVVLKLAQGDIPLESFPSDYRAVDGLQIPFKIRIVLAGLGVERMLALESVTHNTNLPKEALEPPQEVKALLQRATTKPHQPESKPARP